MDLDAPRPIRVALHLDQASVFVAENRWLLRFVIDGRMVAELTASGDLRLAGNLVPEGHYPNGPLFQFDGSNGSLSVGTASGDGFSLSASGDLRTELPVFEEADPGAPCSDPRGIQIGAATFLGGTPGGGWAMRLDEDGIHLRGRLLSSYPFIP
jgi:hypothetical protein